MAHNIDHICKELRRPFTPEAMQFKIQGKSGPNSTLIVCYVDSRQVTERLNTVCPGQWRDSNSVIINPVTGTLMGVECAIGISPQGTSGYYLERSDVGIQEGGIGGLKAVYSDAFKRAGVKWGVNVPGYYVPKHYVPNAVLNKRGEKVYMSREAEKSARDAYATWLKAEGVERFGPTLDLGDTPDAQGDVEVEPEEQPPEPEQNGDGPEWNADFPKRLTDAKEGYKSRGGTKEALVLFANSKAIDLRKTTGLLASQKRALIQFLETNPEAA